MKIVLQRFLFECVCVAPMLVDFCYVLGYSTQKTFSEPFSHAFMMKKRSLRIANTAKFDSLFSVLCVSCVLAQVKPLKLFF
jgi:hypothetical protein